jgi:signal transduction histidine kinase
MTPPPEAGRHRGWPHLTVRLRLTLLLGALFVGGGAVLLSLNYLLVEQSFNQNRDEVRTAIARRTGVSEAELRRVFETPPLGGTSSLPPPPGGKGLFEDVQAEITQSHLDRLLVQSLIALGVMSVVSVGLGWVVAGRVLRPVHEMTGTARRLSESNLDERIALSGPEDELKELADTFDAMLDRLESAFDSQRRFVADASHELRTPLSIIRTEVDVALAAPDTSAEELRRMGEIVRDATERSERLIDSLLALARSDSAGPSTETCDLAEVAAAAVERVAPAADFLGLGLELTLGPAPVIGDRVLLDRLVGNLVENAVHHNERNGWMLVSTSQIDGAARLRVANGGPRIDPDGIPQLTHRFHRGRTRAGQDGGFGLGLSIVESVTRALGGSLQLTAPDGGGLEATVTIPARIGDDDPARQPVDE